MTPRSDTLDPAGDSVSPLPPSTDAAERRPTRFLGVVPVLLVLLVLAGGALAVSPALRHQLAQSFTRQDQGYLELFFVDEQAARSCPVDAEKRVQVDVGVTSHFDSPRSLAWTVTVDPTRGTVRAQRDQLEIRPGATARFTADVPVDVAAGSAAFTVTVTLAGHAERLLLHC